MIPRLKSRFPVKSRFEAPKAAISLRLAPLAVFVACLGTVVHAHGYETVVGYETAATDACTVSLECFGSR